MLSLPNQVSHTFCRKHFRLKYLIELSCCSTNPVAFWVCMWCLLDKWLPNHVFLFSRIALHCIISPMQLWSYACFVCLLNASCGVSLSLCACIVASHLGTLDARRVELKDKVRAEPEDGVLVDASRRWTDGSRCACPKETARQTSII